MSDGISFFSNDDLDEHVRKVMAQTNYTEDQARDKLKLFNCDYMKVLKDYLCIPEKEIPKVKSVNQEIFRQIRTKLDNSMKDYRQKHPVNLDQVITNLHESDEREKTRIKN